MKDPLFVRVAYEWGNPYRPVPDGQPRVLAEVFYRYKDYDGRKVPPEIEAVARLGSGYSMTVIFINEPPKQMRVDQLANIRQKRLRRRVEKKYPLFAEQIIAEEVTANPDYYEGVTREDIQAGHDAVIEREWERIREIEKILGGMEGMSM